MDPEPNPNPNPHALESYELILFRVGSIGPIGPFGPVGLIPQTDLSEWGSDGLVHSSQDLQKLVPRSCRWRAAEVAPLDFDAQARHLVVAAVVSSTQNGRSRHFG